MKDPAEYVTVRTWLGLCLVGLLLAWVAWRVLDLGDGLARIGELMRKYLDRPMDFADASLVWVAEQTGVLEILTTDRDFEIYRTRALRRIDPIDW